MGSWEPVMRGRCCVWSDEDGSVCDNALCHNRRTVSPLVVTNSCNALEMQGAGIAGEGLEPPTRGL
jgi:hypothetical protein